MPKLFSTRCQYMNKRGGRVVVYSNGSGYVFGGLHINSFDTFVWMLTDAIVRERPCINFQIIK
jgi:hypothetical protein